MPQDFHRLLKTSIGKFVLVRLKNRGIVKGRLIGFDQHMNLILEEAHFMKEARKLGSIILRGDNIIYITLPRKT
ncbi:MAG: LSM domain-containing protein [Candidatus Njordarchaeales archaeon]